MMYFTERLIKLYVGCFDLSIKGSPPYKLTSPPILPLVCSLILKDLQSTFQQHNRLVTS